MDCEHDGGREEGERREACQRAVAVGLLVVVELGLIREDRLRVAQLVLLALVATGVLVPLLPGEGRAADGRRGERLANAVDVVEVLHLAVRVNSAFQVCVHHVQVGVRRVLSLHEGRQDSTDEGKSFHLVIEFKINKLVIIGVGLIVNGERLESAVRNSTHGRCVSLLTL